MTPEVKKGRKKAAYLSKLMTFEVCTQMTAKIIDMTKKKKIESTTKLACLVFYFFGACLWKIENLAKEIST